MISLKYNIECDFIYISITVGHMSIRQVAEDVDYTPSMIYRRILSMKETHPKYYKEIKSMLDYNKKYRFKPRYLWDQFDANLL